MAIEILSVSLSEESVARIADAVAAQLLPAQRATTHSNPPSAQNPQPAERPGFQQESDPWLDSPDSQQRPAVETGPAEKHCRHGKMRFVEAGVSASGRKYNAFYGCPLERGNPDQCKPVRP